MVSECNSQEFFNFHLLTFRYCRGGWLNGGVDYIHAGGRHTGWKKIHNKSTDDDEIFIFAWGRVG
jgi:hypothetical protein